MKKVLYFGMSSNLGGIESFIINFWRAFDKDKVHIDFVKMDDHICFEDEIINGGSKIFKLPLRRKNPIKYILELCTFFMKHPEYQIVHVHLNTCSSIEPALIAKIFGRTVIAHSHNEWKGKQKISKVLHLINKPLLNIITDKRLACSNKAGRWMFGDKEYTVINNAINTSLYLFDKYKRQKVRKEFNIENKFVVGNIGRFTYQKNQEFLIDVFNKVHEKNKDAILLLIGDGELRSKLEQKVLDYSLTKNVILTGVRHDVPDLLQAIDIFVLPSHFEGLGLVAIEAQASGLPCIISNTIPEEAFVTNSIENLSLDENLEKWSEKILEFGKNFERKNSYNDIKNAGYDIETTSKELEHIYFIN